MNSIVDLFENVQNIQKSAAQLENAFKRVQTRSNAFKRVQTFETRSGHARWTRLSYGMLFIETRHNFSPPWIRHLVINRYLLYFLPIDVVSVLNVTVKSVGTNDAGNEKLAYILVNNKNYAPQTKGYNVAVFDFLSGIYSKLCRKRK